MLLAHVTQCFGSSSFQLTNPSYIPLHPFPSLSREMDCSCHELMMTIIWDMWGLRSGELGFPCQRTGPQSSTRFVLVYYMILTSYLLSNSFVFCKVNINSHSAYVAMDQNPNEKIWMKAYMNCKWQKVWKELWPPIIRALGREPGLTGGRRGAAVSQAEWRQHKHGFCSQGTVSPHRWGRGLWEESLK